MDDLACLFSFIFYLLTIIATLEVAVKAESYLKVAFFVILFYSVAPLFPFEDFSYFSFYSDYRYRWDVFFVYGVVNLTLLIMAFLVHRINVPIVMSSQIIRSGINRLWYLFAAAFIFEVYFNFPNLIAMNKAARLASPELQTKNLLFITVPAVEILVGYLVYDVHKKCVSLPRVVFGLLAVAYSLALGVRHVAFAAFILIFLPFVNSRIILIILLLLITFAGELSNVLKISVMIFFQDGIDAVISYLERFFSVGFFNQLSVSNEQKAILTNLLLKLDYAELRETSYSILIFLLPLGAQFASWLGGVDYEGATRLGELVGVGLGQGTAYSVHIMVFENYLALILLAFGVLMVAKQFNNSCFGVLVVMVIYAYMRTDFSYSGYLFWKVFMLSSFFSIISILLGKIKLRYIFS